jgi:hypothetical protein
MNKNRNFLPWVLIIGILVIMGLSATAIILSIQRTTRQVVQPVSDMTSDLGTQVARILHPTPTIFNQIRPLARLETIQYTVEKVITAEVGQGALAPLFGDRLLFVGHGYVTAGVDLSKLNSEDLVFDDGQMNVHLPDAEIFIATLDNSKSYVYDRDTGLLTHGDINLETAARQAAEEQIRQAALEDGILEQAQTNAENFIQSLLNKLGFTQVSFTPSGK